MWQDIVVIGLVAAAGAYLVRRYLRRRASSCGFAGFAGCDGCPGPRMGGVESCPHGSDRASCRKY